MHLLATQSGVVDGNAEAVDLDQTPGDLIIISAADSELASLARAHDQLKNPLSLRLANQMSLSHNLSVDVYCEKTAKSAKLIIARVLGGQAYWQYGVDQLVSLAKANNIKLVFLPGGNDPDEDLSSLSTIPAEQCERIRQYISQGGEENAGNLLKFCQHLLRPEIEQPAPPARLAKSGIYTQTQSPGSISTIAITFYRALIEGGLTTPVDALVEQLNNLGHNVIAIYVSSLKDPDCAAEISKIFAKSGPDLILNATAFATGDDNPFTAYDCPVLQTVFSGTSLENWQESPIGLPTRDLAMNIVLPELDGRIMTRAVSFKADHIFHENTQCRIVTYQAVPDRVEFTTKLASNWINLRKTAAKNRKIAIILANYPNRDGRIGNGVGYDTPASTINILNALKTTGYNLGKIPANGNALIEQLQRGPTNARRPETLVSDAKLSLNQYLEFFAQLPEINQKEISKRWDDASKDPFFSNGNFHLPVCMFGNIATAIQPARGYNIDPVETYHDPALVPPHGYLAFYFWLREVFGAHAIIHNGKHGNLEWLPGKSVGLSKTCYPEVVMGPVPQLYPFIVNDPGEGTQAKRRTAAVIIDHLTPPLTRAETYGPYRDLEALIDEYYLASGLDARRVKQLKKQILELTQSSGLDEDAGFDRLDDDDKKLQQLDTYICELKEAQIRDGLHILGEPPKGQQETDLLVALTRTARGIGKDNDQSIIKALVADFGFRNFDPFDCEAGSRWDGRQPSQLVKQTNQPWRSNGDTLERLEILAAKLVAGEFNADDLPQTAKVIKEIEKKIRPSLLASGKNEIANLLKGLNGNFVPAGPSGAPTRGRLDVLPTGKNFYSVDNRAIPTPTAWSLGQKSAENMLLRHYQENGAYPKSLGLSVWGTSNMRTGGDDIAQALALIGAKPVWDTASWRVTGYEIIPLPKLARPRVDVTLRISGFFRDAFPTQIELFDKAVRDIGALDEPEDENPLAARISGEVAELTASGLDRTEATHLAGFRIFGSKPGSYGAGLQALIDEKMWTERSDLAAAYITWGAYAYGKGATGKRDEKTFRKRLKNIEAVVHNQDNREHDLLDSDDYYQFEGGMTAAVEETSGDRPIVYHNDHSRPEKPVTRTLQEEIGRVMRSRVTNPKWINGVKRHGYKGAFEIAATVDYMFAFAATTGAVKPHHFELAYEAFLNDEDTRAFIENNNRQALTEIADRFNEAIARNLWTPKSNSAYNQLNALRIESSDDKKS